MSIRIVTDSSCDLPSELVRENQIEVVPLTVVVGGREYLEGVTISASEFASLMRASPDLPKTSQPSPHAFITAFERVAKTAGDAAEVLCLTLSSKLSGTFQSACTARGLFQGSASVVDSRSGTLGLGLLTLEAGRLARLGHSLVEITEKLNAMRDQLSVFVSVETLENAVKGGRISRVHAAVAQVLRMKILLQTREGSVEVCGRVRGRKSMLTAFMDAMQTRAADYRNRIVGITHVDNLVDAEVLAEMITQRFCPKQVILAPMGSTIATYAGVGALALAY